jgi:hypothetical protein
MSSIKCQSPGCNNPVTKGIYCATHFPQLGDIDKFSVQHQFDLMNDRRASSAESYAPRIAAPPKKSPIVLILIIAALAILAAIAGIVIFIKLF